MTDTTYTNDVHRWVQDYYGKVLASSADLKTNACCAAPPPGWLRDLLNNVHPEVKDRFFGCGFPIPAALEGATVVDLGCGTGRDVFLISQLVGPQGRVFGLDMTEEQLEVGRRHLTWHAEKQSLSASNVELVRGYIEDLSDLKLQPRSVDVVVSNCVVNLSPRKDLVLAQVHQLLKEGGEFYLSDVVVDRRLPNSLAHDPVLHSECLGGALYRHDFEDLARAAGFLDPRIMEVTPISIQNDEIQEKVGAARFFSVTYRLFKISGLEPRCEDYGQVATYRGDIPFYRSSFTLDDHHVFERGRPERVCGNTAAMLETTRLRNHFSVTGSRNTHFGLFDCSETFGTKSQGSASGGLSSASCC